MDATRLATTALLVGLALGCAGKTPRANCIPIPGMGGAVCRPDVPEQTWRRQVERGNEARRAGDYPAAEKRYRNALEIAPETFQPHPFASAAHNNLAALFWKQSRYREAADHYALSVSEWDASGRPDDDYIASVLRDQANVLRELGRESEAGEAEARAAAAMAGSRGAP